MPKSHAWDHLKSCLINESSNIVIQPTEYHQELLTNNIIDQHDDDFIL